MIVQYASDLHLEFRDNTSFLAGNPLKVVGNILVLAGDIWLLGKNKIYSHPFFDWCADNYEQTFIVPGNHEYYNRYELEDTLEDFELRIRPNVSYLNNKSMIMEDTEFFFSTLWAKVSPLEVVPVQLGMTDCHRIRFKGVGFTANDYNVVFEKSLVRLTEMFSVSTAMHKVVVTHHCPTKRFADPRFSESTINSAFCVDLDAFIEENRPDYWIFGHTHYNGGDKERIGHTQLLCNQLGYVKYGENRSFRRDACFTMGSVR